MVVGKAIGPRRKRTGSDSYYYNELPELKNFNPPPRRRPHTDPSGLADHSPRRPIGPRIIEGFKDVGRTAKSFWHGVESGRISGGIQKWWNQGKDKTPRKIRPKGPGMPVAQQTPDTGFIASPRVSGTTIKASPPAPPALSKKPIAPKKAVTRPISPKVGKRKGKAPPPARKKVRKGNAITTAPAPAQVSQPKGWWGSMSRGRQNTLLAGAGFAGGFLAGRLSKRRAKGGTVYSGSYVRNYYY